MLNQAFNEIKSPPRVFGNGTLKVCWPKDMSVEERQHDMQLAARLIFRDYGAVGDESHQNTINATVVTTQAALLRKKDTCVLVASRLIDDPNAKWNNPAVRTLTPDQNRLFAPDGIASKNGSEEEPLPDSLMTIQPDAFVISAFR
jgi:hypothetical protein